MPVFNIIAAKITTALVKPGKEMGKMFEWGDATLSKAACDDDLHGDLVTA